MRIEATILIEPVAKARARLQLPVGQLARLAPGVLPAAYTLPAVETPARGGGSRRMLPPPFRGAGPATESTLLGETTWHGKLAPALATFQLGAARIHTALKRTVLSRSGLGRRFAGQQPSAPRTGSGWLRGGRCVEQDAQARFFGITHKFCCNLYYLLVVLPDNTSSSVHYGLEQVVYVNPVLVLAVKYGPGTEVRLDINVAAHYVLVMPSECILIVLGFAGRINAAASIETGARLAGWFYIKMQVENHLACGNTVGPFLEVIVQAIHSYSILCCAIRSQLTEDNPESDFPPAKENGRLL